MHYLPLFLTSTSPRNYYNTTLLLNTYHYYRAIQITFFLSFPVRVLDTNYIVACFRDLPPGKAFSLSHVSSNYKHGVGDFDFVESIWNTS